MLKTAKVAIRSSKKSKVSLYIIQCQCTLKKKITQKEGDTFRKTYFKKCSAQQTFSSSVKDKIYELCNNPQ